MNMHHPRLVREQETIQKMIQLYCREVHLTQPGAPCEDCLEISQYALERLHRCPFQEKKPTCARCTVHCYRPAMREKIRKIMRYAGPRMLRHHPGLALLHLIDGLRKPPVRKRRSG